MKITVADTTVHSFELVNKEDGGWRYQGSFGSVEDPVMFCGPIHDLIEFERWCNVGMEIAGEKLKSITVQSRSGGFENFELVDYELYE